MTDSLVTITLPKDDAEFLCETLIDWASPVAQSLSEILVELAGSFPAANDLQFRANRIKELYELIKPQCS